MRSGLARLDQVGELGDGIEGGGGELEVVDAHAEVVFDQQGQVDEGEGVDQAGGDERFIGRNDPGGLLEDLGGDFFGQLGDEGVGHGVSCRDGSGAGVFYHAKRWKRITRRRGVVHAEVQLNGKDIFRIVKKQTWRILEQNVDNLLMQNLDRI
jgi:hypothetical protein